MIDYNLIIEETHYRRFYAIKITCTFNIQLGDLQVLLTDVTLVVGGSGFMGSLSRIKLCCVKDISFSNYHFV